LTVDRLFFFLAISSLNYFATLSLEMALFSRPRKKAKAQASPPCSRSILHILSTTTTSSASPALSLLYLEHCGVLLLAFLASRRSPSSCRRFHPIHSLLNPVHLPASPLTLDQFDSQDPRFVLLGRGKTPHRIGLIMYPTVSYFLVRPFPVCSRTSPFAVLPLLFGSEIGRSACFPPFYSACKARKRASLCLSSCGLQGSKSLCCVEYRHSWENSRFKNSGRLYPTVRLVVQ